MNLKRVYDIIHAVLKKESRGNIIKPERFTYILQQANLEYFNQQYEKFAASQTIQDSLSPFIVVDESVSFTTGSAATSTLSSTYIHLISARTSADVRGGTTCTLTSALVLADIK